MRFIHSLTLKLKHMKRLSSLRKFSSFTSLFCLTLGIYCLTQHIFTFFQFPRGTDFLSFLTMSTGCIFCILEFTPFLNSVSTKLIFRASGCFMFEVSLLSGAIYVFQHGIGSPNILLFLLIATYMTTALLKIVTENIWIYMSYL